MPAPAAPAPGLPRPLLLLSRRRRRRRRPPPPLKCGQPPPPPPPARAPPASQNQLQADLPFCAFNGGNDVFVDVGNKSLGLEALMGYLGFSPPEVGASSDALLWCGRGSVQDAVVDGPPCCTAWQAAAQPAGITACRLSPCVRPPHGMLHAGAARGRPLLRHRQRQRHTRLLLHPVGGKP